MCGTQTRRATAEGWGVMYPEVPESSENWGICVIFCGEFEFVNGVFSKISSKLVSLDATMADGNQAHIRNVHFSCVPIVAKAIKMCSVIAKFPEKSEKNLDFQKTCTTQIYKNEKSSKSIDRSVGSLKRVLVKEIGVI